MGFMFLQLQKQIILSQNFGFGDSRSESEITQPSVVLVSMADPSRKRAVPTLLHASECTTRRENTRQTCFRHRKTSQKHVSDVAVIIKHSGCILISFWENRFSEIFGL